MTNWVSEVGCAWWTVIGLSALKSTLLLAMTGWLVSRLRHRSPAVRFRVWAGGLLTAAATPLAAAILPAWDVLPSWLNANLLMGADGAIRKSSSLGASAMQWLSWLLAALALIWLGGVILVVARTLLAAAVLRRWVRRSVVLDDDHRTSRLCREMQALLGVRTKVTLIQAQTEVIPMTWGLLRTRLLLPKSASDWSDQRLRAVLLHELGHVLRRDGLVQVLVQWVSACYWFHPSVWWACEQIRFEREAACDDLVLAAGVRATDYAESLLQLSHPGADAWRAPALAVAMAEPQTLETRILEILDARRVRTRTPIVQAAFVGASLLLALTALSMMEPSGLDQEPSAANLARTSQPSPAPDTTPAKESVESAETTSPELLAAAPAETSNPFADAQALVRRPSSLIRLDSARTEHLLSDVVSPDAPRRELKPISGIGQAPLNLPPPGLERAGDAQRDPMDPRDQVSQTSSSPLRSRRPMPL